MKTSATPNKTLPAYMTELRLLANQGEDAQVRKMLLLVDLFQAKELWIHVYGSWSTFLDLHRFATPSLFQRFRSALSVMSDKDAKRFGVKTTALLGSLPLDIRQGIIDRVRAWVMEHKIPPEYQRVTEYVKQIAPSTPRPKDGKKVLTLLRHIGKLNRLLRDCGVRPPEVPKV